ncbi:MAG: hypothetical protein GY754_25650 [bacterium]|nr:hypothetical protein [bacterium]
MIKKIISAIIKSGTAAAIVLSAGALYASNFGDTYGFSAKGISKGNAMCAIVDDWSSVWYNPAGLGKTVAPDEEKAFSNEGDGMMSLKMKSDRKEEKVVKKEKKNYKNQLSMTYLYSYSMLDIDFTSAYAAVGSNDPAANKSLALEDLNVGFVIIGLAVDLNTIYEMPKFISSARMGVGLGMSHDGAMAKIHDIDHASYNYMRYGKESQRAIILAAFGFGFLDDTFGVGVGANVSYGGSGALVLTNVNMVSEQEPEEEMQMTLSLRPSLTAGLYFSPGKLLSLLNGLEVGTSYRMENKVEIDPLTAETNTKLGGIALGLTVANLDFYAPHIVVGGIAYTRWNTTLSIDFEYQFWSGFEVSSTDTDASNSNNVAIPKLRNIPVVRVGVGVDILDWFDAMVGYYYQPSFISEGEDSGAANYLDNDKHVISLGALFEVPPLAGMTGPVEIVVGYQFQYLVSRSVNKTTADNTTTNPSYNYGGMAHGGTLSVCLKI